MQGCWGQACGRGVPERRPREAIVWHISWNVFWSLCFPLSALHSSAHLAIHTTSLCSFFQNNHRNTTKKKSNQTNEKQIRQKKSAKTKQKVHKTPHGDHFVLATIYVCVAFLPSHVLIYPVTLHDRKLIFLCKWFFQLQIDSWLEWDPMSTFHSQSCDSVYVGLVHAASLCEFINPVVSGRYNFIGVIYHLWLFQSFHLLFVDSLALRGVVGGKQILSLSVHYPTVGLCIIHSHLLQEVSLMRGDQCIDLWVRQYVIVAHFIFILS